MSHPIAHRRSLAIVLAITVLASLATALAAEAQFLPAVLYGGGLKSGQKVEAFIGGLSCGSTTASAKGEWVMQIPADAACKPQAGNHINFKVDGADAAPSPVARWESGGIPTGSVATGYTLTTDAIYRRKLRHLANTIHEAQERRPKWRSDNCWLILSLIARGGEDHDGRAIGTKALNLVNYERLAQARVLTRH